MNIGMKMVASLGVIAAVISLVGLYFVYQQEEANMMQQLEARGQVIQAQVEVTRSYIARNYVGKMKKSSAGSSITVARNHVRNPEAIPFPATATREIGEELGKRGIFQSRLISSTPLNPANQPNDSFERSAITAIAAGADSFSRVEDQATGLVFRRASADKATVQACTGCHTGSKVGDTLGVLAVSIPIASVHAAMIESVKRTGGLLVGITVVTLIMVYVLLHQLILVRLKQLTGISRDIAQGEGDLTKRVPVSGKDELGQLGKNFNLFIERLHQSLRRVGQLTDDVASASTQVSETANEIARGSETQTQRVTQSASAVEEMTMTAGEVAQNSLEAANIANETSQTASTGHQVVDETVAGMRQLSEAVGQSASIITQLGKSSDQIGEIVRVIEDIADQTNLLALNAAIEAARAGEQGRGFAVVADEVRKLAERTTKATKEIGDMIRQIQNDTKIAVTSMEEGTGKVAGGVELANRTGHALTQIKEMVLRTASMIQQIAGAAEQQSVATKQIADDLETVAQVSRESSSGSDASAKASRNLSQLATELQGIVSEFKV